MHIELFEQCRPRREVTCPNQVPHLCGPNQFALYPHGRLRPNQVHTATNATQVGLWPDWTQFGVYFGQYLVTLLVICAFWPDRYQMGHVTLLVILVRYSAETTEISRVFVDLLACPGYFCHKWAKNHPKKVAILVPSC